MENKLVSVTSLITFVVWAITIVLIVGYYLLFLSVYYELHSLEIFLIFLVISFVVPFVLCKILDKLLPKFGYIFKGTASILVVFLVGSLCLTFWNALITFELLLGMDDYVPQSTFLDNLQEFSVPWILVVITYYGLQSSRKRLSKTNTESQILESDSSLVDFGSEEFYKKLNTPPKAAALAVELHRRSNFLTNQATNVLVIIIAVLFVTAVFVVFAGQISGFGAKPINHLSNMIAERNEFGNHIFRLRRQLEDIERDIDKTKIKPTGPERKVDLEELERKQSNTSIQIVDLVTQEKNLDKTIQELRGALIVRESGSNTNQFQSDLNIISQLLLAAGITRFGVVIIAIYLVQILSNLYRYNIQTAAHYRAVADFIILANPKDYEKIKALDGALLPDISFGKTPKMISQKITNSFVEALESFIPKLRHSVENSLRNSGKSKQPRDFED